ncbi:MAG: TIM barrel protein [Terracidiphilus sp.]|jgi:sugar phosphate isomerase/epimerase
MAFIGFSTGALSLGNFQESLRLMNGTSVSAVELSALRLPELPELIEALPSLNLGQFSYVSVHAPSRFSADEEDDVIDHLRKVKRECPIIVHPDTIHISSRWADFGNQLAIENMDRRKREGRSAEELCRWFELLPNARLCFDLAHAHQCDRTMTEAFRILLRFRNRICQLHISELDSAGRHFPLSFGSIQAFSEIASMIPADSPAILESLNPHEGEADELQRAWIEREMIRAKVALGREGVLRSGPVPRRTTALTSDPVPA